MSKDFKEKVFKYIKKEYGVEPDYPWGKYPGNAVFRHEDNKKWFALVMTVSKDKLGLSGTSHSKSSERIKMYVSYSQTAA
ncbi:MAG: hypothetical protein VZR53_18440 [Prevotella sp.]|nr:hypothetical protein [Prevotella sp.]